MILTCCFFCERAIRGGINGIGAVRHFKDNNKYMEDFDKSQQSVFGAFFGVTSLYAGTMQQPSHVAIINGETI